MIRLPSYVALALMLVAPCALAADLSVTVVGVKNAEGDVRVMLFDRPEGFRHEDKARTVLATPAKAGDVRVTFTTLPVGTYGVIAYHDENANHVLDKFMGMIPTEGFALSNDPEVVGPPSFDSAAITLGEAGSSITIHLKY